MKLVVHTDQLYPVKKTSLSIVTYNNNKVIDACIQSLLTYTDKTTLIIVDNKSKDNTLNILRSYAENNRIKLIQNQVNIGFGSAHNMAINKVDSDYHILCNPDIVINSQTINALTDYMNLHADIGILCPKLLNTDGSLQPNNHQYPTVLDLALRRLAPRWLQKHFKTRMDAYLMLNVGYEAVYDVPFLSGAFMFCRTQALTKVSGFDERYFLYFEDADLCRKMHQAGYRTVYYPNASVTHHWERAAYKNWRIAATMVISALKYFSKWGYRFY